MNPRSTEWLASGGAYWWLAGQTFVIAIVSAFAAIRIGALMRAENDGCIMAPLNILLTFFGAAVGFFLLPYPEFVVSSLLGALLFPALATTLTALRWHKLYRQGR